jgi:hypothetical protein
MAARAHLQSRLCPLVRRRRLQLTQNASVVGVVHSGVAWTITNVMQARQVLWPRALACAGLTVFCVVVVFSVAVVLLLSVAHTATLSTSPFYVERLISWAFFSVFFCRMCALHNS